MAKKAFEDELEAQLRKLTSPGVRALVTEALAPVEEQEPSSPSKQPNQAAQVSSLGKQLNQAAQVSSPSGVPAGVSSPSKQPNQAAQVSSLGKQLNQAAQVSSPTKHDDRPPVRLSPRCELASPAQKAVLRYFQVNGTHVASYDIISNDSRVPRGTVRQIVDKMVKMGCLSKTSWRDGKNCGLLFTFNGGLSLGQAVQVSSPSKQPNQAAQVSSPNAPLKIDREKNLSISQERVDLTWPNLAATGFGAHQIEQISQALAELGKPADRIVQSLDHAEWELEHGRMLDKDGQPVTDPCSWVFRALSRTGYYRRPKGYVSPEEQADIDAATEAQARAKSREIAREARFQAWAKGLSQSERENALEGRQGPSEAWLKNVWLKRGEPD